MGKNPGYLNGVLKCLPAVTGVVQQNLLSKWPKNTHFCPQSALKIDLSYYDLHDIIQ